MPFQVFTGEFENFAAAKSSLEMFGSKIYLDKASERLNIALSSSKSFNDYILVPLVAGLLSDYSNFSILDFGGGPGITYLSLHQTVQGKNFTYHVFDRAEICTLGRSRLSDHPQLTFHDQLQNLENHYDLVHFGSVLQYIDDLPGLLSLIATKTPKHILVSDAMVGSGKTFVTQENYYGSKLPFRFHSFADFEEKFEAIGYESVLRVPFIPMIQGKRQFYDMSNLSENCRVDCTYHVLFRAR